MKTLTFTAVDLLYRAQEKFQDPKNSFCHGDLDAALDDALLEMKWEIATLRVEVDRALAEPDAMQTPDLPDWEKLVARLR